MTIHLPQKTLSDRILSVFSKKRALKIPDGVYENFGPHVYARAQKENFWRALLRPRGRKPPAGYFYPEDYRNENLKEGLDEGDRKLTRSE